MTYTYRELKAEKGYFRNDPKFGRTTKLVHIPTGTVLHEVLGVLTKSAMHIQYLRHCCQKNGEAHQANPNY